MRHFVSLVCDFYFVGNSRRRSEISDLCLSDVHNLDTLKEVLTSYNVFK